MNIKNSVGVFALVIISFQSFGQYDTSGFQVDIGLRRGTLFGKQITPQGFAADAKVTSVFLTMGKRLKFLVGFEFQDFSGLIDTEVMSQNKTEHFVFGLHASEKLVNNLYLRGTYEMSFIDQSPAMKIGVGLGYKLGKVVSVTVDYFRQNEDRGFFSGNLLTAGIALTKPF